MSLPTSTAAFNPVVKKIAHLGPYDISDVTDAMLADLVARQNIPIIISQEATTFEGEAKINYAVLVTKDVKLACVGCFNRDMNINDRTQVKKIASFVKHWASKHGTRLLTCKACGLMATLGDDATKVEVVMETTAHNPTEATLTGATDEEILRQVQERGLVIPIMENASEEELGGVMQTRGVIPLYDARTSRLVHELNRQANGATIESYYLKGKEKGKPHCSDRVGATLTCEEDGGGVTTRRKRKKENPTIVFDAKAADDYTPSAKDF